MKAQRLLGSTVFLAGANTLNSFLALFGRQLVAYFFGRGPLADAFFLAQTVPRELMWWFRRALKAACIPVYSQRLLEEDRERAWRTISSFSTLATLIAGALAVAYYGAAPYLVPLLAPGLDAEGLATLTRLTRLLSPLMVLIVAYGLAESALNAHKHFTSPGLSQLCVPLGLIAGTWLGSERWGIYAPLGGLVIGFVLQVLLLVPVFRHFRGLARLRIDLADLHTRAIGVQILPIVIGYTLGNLNPLLARSFGTMLGTGRVAALNFAWSIVNVLPLVLVNSLGTTLFPTLSESVVRGDRESLGRICVTYIRAAMYLFLPTALSTMVLREPLVRLLYERGEFDQTATAMTAAALLGYAPCILTSTIIMFFQQLFFARKRSVVVMQTVIVGLVTNVVAMLALMRSLDVLGIALAYALMAFVQILFLLYRLRREMGELPLAGLVSPLLRVLACGAVLVGVELSLIGVAERQFGTSGLLPNLATAALVAGAGATAYVACSWALGLSEPRQLVGIGGKLARKLRGGGPPA